MGDGCCTGSPIWGRVPKVLVMSGFLAGMGGRRACSDSAARGPALLGLAAAAKKEPRPRHGPHFSPATSELPGALRQPVPEPVDDRGTLVVRSGCRAERH